MSQGFTAVNLPREDEAPMGSQAVVLYKDEDMEDNVGDADATETAAQASLATPAPGSNTTKKRSPKPKNAQTNADGTPAPKTPRKNAKQKELNEDGTPVVKATSARKKPAPKVDEDGNIIPKTPRKKAEPKPKTGLNGESLPKTPRKNAKKVKSEDKVVDDEAGDVDMAGDMVSSMVGDIASAKMPGYGDEDSSALKSYYAPTPNGGSSPVSATEERIPEPTTPKANKPAAKARAATGTPGSKKKRAAGEDGENDPFTTPTKKIKAAAGTPKTGNGKGMSIGASVDQLSHEDKVLVQMKQDGKGWPEIREKWKEMTGKVPGGSTLSNRYARIMANLTDWKDGDIERMLVANEKVIGNLAEEVEVKRKLLAEELEAKRKETEAQLRRLEGEVYARMAVVMVDLGADTYSAAAIEKAFLKEKREGFPHKETISQVINGAAATASEDEGMGAIDEAINGDAASARDDQAMEDPETPDEENSDGGVPISPGHDLKSESIKGEDDGEMDSDMA
ncbi:hypothetical protein V501_08187 [Pseudogymnoascus sp. VKM F-4519 (FW-2642)]|nr:hypothetical protein V501_08187 [Pseudogymnoascus sp. VKM F-4519 (FW-2642)]